MAIRNLPTRCLGWVASLISPRLLERMDVILHAEAARHYSQEGEDIILGRIFEGRHSGSFIDIGAHHPRRFSNTCLFYLRGWSGMNIEPNPDAIQLFRVERPRDINVQSGVSDVAGELNYCMFDEPALNTFDTDLAADRERTTPFRMTGRQRIDVQRLDILLDRYWPEGRPIDFMSIDVEGFDLKVAQSNDWNRYRPSYVLVECLGSDMERLAEEPMHHFLSRQDYTLYAKTVNTFIYRDRRTTG